jgi:multisubunit Na+/H+ antiporter MnhC subunit
VTGNLTLAVVVGALFAFGTSLVLQRSLTRVLLGFVLLGHAANLLVLTVAGRSGPPPFTTPTDGRPAAADPLPQAMAVTCLLLTLAYRSWQLTGSDEVQDDVEDQRVARDRDGGQTDPSADDPGPGGVDSSGDGGSGDGGHELPEHDELAVLPGSGR